MPCQRARSSWNSCPEACGGHAAPRPCRESLIDLWGKREAGPFGEPGAAPVHAFVPGSHAAVSPGLALPIRAFAPSPSTTAPVHSQQKGA